MTASDLRLETSRLMLRAHRLEDLAALHALDTDEEARRFNSGIADLATTRRYLERAIADFGHGEWKFAVDLISMQETVGWVWLKPQVLLGGVEVGYQMARTHWGQGIATEAARRVLDFAFGAAGLEIVYAVIDPANMASVRVAEKLGMGLMTQLPWDCPTGYAHVYRIERR